MEEQLLSAVEIGDKSSLKAILNQQPELINIVFDEHNKTVFELALENGFSDIAKELVHNTHFHLNHSEHNPLRLSIDLGYLDIAEALLKKGANPNYRPKQMSSALLLCLENEYFDLAELMIKCGAEVNIRNSTGWTPLIWTSIKGRVKAVDFLLKHVASVSICNNDGWNAVTGAFFKQRTEVVSMLFNAGAVFSAKFAEAALILAYKNGQRDIVLQLLDDGVNPDVENEEGEQKTLRIVGVDEIYDHHPQHISISSPMAVGLGP